MAFRLGTNLPWIDGQYGHDLGANFLTQTSAYLDPRGNEFHDKVQRLRGYFRQIREDFGFSYVRFWVFEGGEGIEPLGASCRLDPTLVKNLRLVLDLAADAGLQLYLMLLSSHPTHTHTAFEMDQRLIREMAAHPRQGFVADILIPLLTQVGSHPALWAVDVINEPEKYVVYGSSWAEVQGAIVACADVIRQATDGRVLVSTGCDVRGWTAQTMKQALQHYTGLGLDFFDVHLYDDRGEISDDYRMIQRSLGVREPCILGEYGQRTAVYDDTLQSMSTENFLTQARSKGFAGAFSWFYTYPGFPSELRNEDFRYSLTYCDGTPRPVHQVVRRFAGLSLDA